MATARASQFVRTFKCRPKSKPCTQRFASNNGFMSFQTFLREKNSLITPMCTRCTPENLRCTREILLSSAMLCRLELVDVTDHTNLCEVLPKVICSIFRNISTAEFSLLLCQLSPEQNSLVSIIFCSNRFMMSSDFSTSKSSGF